MYPLLLLILVKAVKNASMVINYFAKLFYFKRDKFCIQKMNKKISKEAERQGIRWKAIRKNHINKKKKKGYFM